MSDQTMKLLITAVLALHGLGHGGALGALAWVGRRPGTDTGAWLAARSWLFPSLSARTVTTIASIFWILSLVGFVAAALSFWDVLVPGEVRGTARRCLGDRIEPGHRPLPRNLAGVQHARRPGRERRRSHHATVAALASIGDVW